MARNPSETSTVEGDVLSVFRKLLDGGETHEALAVVAKLVARNEELERRLAELFGRGRKSEGISRDQLDLFLKKLSAEESKNDEPLVDANAHLRAAAKVEELLKPEDEATKAKAERQPPLRRPIPESLERVDNPLLVPESERPCPKCGAERTCIGHDVTEVIELVPAKVIVRRDRREKLACEACEGELVRAPVGEKVVGGGRLGPHLVTEVFVGKYRDGLPLHRHRERFERAGLSISVSTLADQIKWATDLFRPLWQAALKQALQAKVMHLDATGLPVLDSEAPSGKRIGTIWGFVGNDEVAVCLYCTTGKKKGQRPGELGPEDVLALRKGYTVADASNVFESSFERDDLIECGCNMHARRKFTQALDRGDERAALPIAVYKRLYLIEEKIQALDGPAKRAARQEESKPVYEALVNWCEVYQPREPPSSPLGGAIRYVLNHKEALMRYLEDGDIPPDNGIVERLHIRTALTRKNFLFAGSDVGAERAAIAFTILGCCHLAGVNPLEYVADTLAKLSRGLRVIDAADMLPAAWKRRRADARAE